MNNVINFPEPSQERPRKFRNPDFAEPLMSRKNKREVVCLRTLQAILAEAPDEIRRMEAGVSTHEQLARPALQEVVAPPEVTDFPSSFPVVSSEGTVADNAQPHDNVAFLSDARARVEEHYQDGAAASSQEGGTVTGIKTYLEQHPRVSSSYVQTDPVDDNLRAIGYGEDQNVAA